MPAHIVLVHDDVKFAEEATAALAAAGHDIAAFSSSMGALAALEAAHHVELLITRIAFPTGPNGISLALVAKRRRPDLKVLFTALEETEKYAEGVGEFLPIPVNIGELVGTVSRMITPSGPPIAPEVRLPGAVAE